jgi:membrane dipeptidase
MKNHLCPLSIAVALIVAPVISYSASASSNDALAARVNRVLEQTPLIDGHNDLPWQIRECFVNVDGVDLRASTANLPKPAKPPEGCDWAPLMTDIPRLRAGHVGGSSGRLDSSSLNGAAAIQTTLEQIDVVHAMTARYPNDLQMAYYRRRHRAQPQGRQDRLADRHRRRPPDRQLAGRRCARCTRSARAT